MTLVVIKKVRGGLTGVADSLLTVPAGNEGGPPFRPVDLMPKVFFVSPTVLIGFAGEVQSAHDAIKAALPLWSSDNPAQLCGLLAPHTTASHEFVVGATRPVPELWICNNGEVAPVADDSVAIGSGRGRWSQVLDQTARAFPPVRFTPAQLQQYRNRLVGEEGWSEAEFRQVAEDLADPGDLTQFIAAGDIAGDPQAAKHDAVGGFMMRIGTSQDGHLYYLQDEHRVIQPGYNGADHASRSSHPWLHTHALVQGASYPRDLAVFVPPNWGYVFRSFDYWIPSHPIQVASAVALEESLM